MKKQINEKLIFLMFIFGTILVVMQIISIRKANIDESFKKAHSIAEIVEAGLTAHMVNGNMNQRNIFLNSISQIETIEGLWIVRGEKVNKSRVLPSFLWSRFLASSSRARCFLSDFLSGKAVP